MFTDRINNKKCNRVKEGQDKHMYYNEFAIGMYVTIKDDNLGKPVTIQIEQIFPHVVKGRIYKKNKKGLYVLTDQVRTFNKKDFFCGWGQAKPIGIFENPYSLKNSHSN